MSDCRVVDIAGLTHRGLVRERNEDHFLIGEVHRALAITQSSLPESVNQELDAGAGASLLVVADGVGGLSGGAEASSLAVDAIAAYVSGALRLCRPGLTLEEDLLQEFTSAITASHARLKSESQENPQYRGLATTLTLAFLLGVRAYVAHVGDSRCYVLRGGVADQVTRDQTYAQEMVDQGLLAPEEAQRSRLRRFLSNVVGGSQETDPEVLTYRLTLEPGDSVLLCTDGLTGHIGEEEIARLESLASSSQEACKDLVDAALEAGGRDNITVVVARLSGIG
jgi:protein phosphatase